MALDQGTTSSRAVIFDQQGKIVSMAAKEFRQIYPRPGWVEHDPVEIWDSQMEAARQALDSVNLSPQRIAAIGVTNQRETTLIWDRESGRPVYNAIVWQCRRTAPSCSEIKKTKFAQKIRRKTGLVIDAYFSATKIQWILDHRKTIRRAAERGELAFGTVDSWLVYNLTGKKLHITDYSNASRTMLYNIHDLSWDGEILEYFHIPEQILPAVKASSEIYGSTSPGVLFGFGDPRCGNRGRSTGSSFRPNLFPQRPVQEYLRNGLLFADEYRGKAGAFQEKSSDDDRLGNRPENRICLRRKRLYCRGRQSNGSGTGYG